MKITATLGCVLGMAACATPPPAPPVADATPKHFDPAPMPFVQVRRVGTIGALEMPIPPKMPLGTGAVPVSGSPVRGSIVTGFHEAF